MSSRSMADRRHTRPLRRPGFPGLAALALCLLASGGVAIAHAASGGLSVCIDRANPFQRIDRTLAEAVGRLTGTTPRFVDIDTRDGTDALNAKHPRFFARLTETRCDLVMGFPVETGAPFLPPGVMATHPYAKTGFVIAGFKAPPSFGELPAGSKIGVVYLTVPTTYFGAGHGASLAEHEYSTPAHVLAALGRHEVDYALLWQPLLEQALSAHPAPIRQRPLEQPHAAWSIVALYAPTPAGRRGARRFDKAIRDLVRTGTLATLIAPYHTP